jgi:hypothetical protein
MATSEDRAEGRGSRTGTVLTVMVMLGFLVASVLVAWYIWQSLAGVTMSSFGVLALIAGILVTVLVGAGLTTLLIVSSRRGYDEGASRHE